VKSADAPIPTPPDAEGRVGTEGPLNALAIDTTSQRLSLALLAAGRPAGECHEDLGRGITQAILPRIDALLKAAGLSAGELDALLLARGPGSFTGTRIGLAVGLTFAQIIRCPVVGVDTLRLLASQAEAGEGAAFHVLLNCARDEVYHAPFVWREGRPRPQGEIALASIHALGENLAGTPVVLRRFPPAVKRPGAGKVDEPTEAAFAALRPMPLRFPEPDAWRLMAEGLPGLPPKDGAGLPRVEPLYLKSEALRGWGGAR